MGDSHCQTYGITYNTTMNRLFPAFLFIFLTAQGTYSESFHFYRWSEEGHFSWFERGEDHQGNYYRFHIVDLVSDEILVEELVRSESQNENQIVAEIGRRYPGSIGDYQLRQGPVGERFSGQDFSFQGKSYRLLIIDKDGESILRILNLSDNRFKDVSILEEAGEHLIQGLVLSPYEKRAALIIKYNGQFQVYGAHLTIGFQQVAFEGNELIEAVLCGQYYITRQLIESGISVNTQDNRGYNALLLACRNEKWQIAELLVSNAADVNTNDALGNTPLHYAAEADQRELAELLCRNGAYLYGENNQGNSPTDLAQSHSMRSILNRHME